MSRIMDLAAISPIEGGGNCRLALTDEDKEGRDLVVTWMKDLGLSVSIDVVGNIIGTWNVGNGAPVMTGSHIDTVRTGGKYDGNLGVLAGLEVIETLQQAGVTPQRPFAVGVFTDEEGARFAPAMMGAAYFAGKFTADELLVRKDVDGVQLGNSLNEIGYAGSDKVSPVEHKAYFEIHIEQGPILQDENLQIGVVTLVQGMRWFRIGITGQSGHTGTYPMETRRDALVAASHLIKAVQQIGLDQPLTGRATVGHIVVTPNSPNVIPGHVELMVEFRNPEVAVLDVMTASLNQALKETADKYGVEVVSKQELDSATIDFTAELIELVEQAASACGKTSKRMISGAGHDACQLSAVMPTTMIFIPCDKGISHAENEAITQEWAADGAQVLVETILSFDSK